MSEKKRVAVAMSGGVDSSVAAALLVQTGYEVVGMMLRLWSEDGSEAANRCCTPDAMAQARRVAAILDIPFYALDARQPFHTRVVQPFIEGYAQGITPNPCLSCNRHIRWGLLLEQAQSLDAAFLATGHYARLRRLPDGSAQLLRAVDGHKDQSYILHILTQEQLAYTLFPLGELDKAAVRQCARDLQLPVAERPESQDLCFLGEGDYRSFLIRQAPDVLRPGPIVDQQGFAIGQHAGLANYTIGQRKGLGVSSAEPLYVLEKHTQTNTLVVGRSEDLEVDMLHAGQVNWIAGAPPPSDFRAQVKIRYKALEAWAEVHPVNRDQVQLHFDQPQRGVTPGQAAVLFKGEVCFGGGIITSTEKTLGSKKTL